MLEGIGFVILFDWVMINVYVVVGFNNVMVYVGDKFFEVMVVFYDLLVDVVILVVLYLLLLLLVFVVELVKIGVDVVVLGYFGGGNFIVIFVRICEVIRFSGFDIYGDLELVICDVYIIRVDVE